MSWLKPTTVAVRLQLGGDAASLRLADGAVAFWRLGELTGTVAADSLGGAPGTYVGTFTLNQATLQPDGNAAVLLDGTNGKVVVSDAPALHVGDVFSIELWVKYTSLLASVQGLVHSTTASALSVRLDASGHPVLVSAGGATIVTATVAITDTNWHHLIVTKNGSAVKLYLDGVDVTGVVSNLTLVSTSTGFTFGALGGASFLNATLDDIALYPTALTPAQALVLFLSGSWTDVSADLTDSNIVLDYGIRSNLPEDRVAGTGQLTFGLRNGTDNSAHQAGYYSPYNANRRAGFQHGLRCQLVLAYSGQTIYWTGRLRLIDAPGDSYGERVSKCTAYDWLDDASRKNLQISILTTVRGDQAFTALVAIVPSQPLIVQADVGSDTYVYAFDNLYTTNKVYSAFADLARSELGYIGQKRDATLGQTVFFESRHSRPVNSTLLVTLDNTMDGLDIIPDASLIINHMRVTVHPRSNDAGGTTAVAALATSTTAGAVPLLPGESQTFLLNYTAPVAASLIRSSFIGATNIQTPLVSGTDFTMNTKQDGTGDDLSFNFTVVASAIYASSVQLVVTNNDPTRGAFITKLQVRGDGVYALNPVVGDFLNTASSLVFGDNIDELDMAYQTDPLFAANAARYIATLYGSSVAHVAGVTFCANQSDTLMKAALFGEISNKVALGEAVTGLQTSQQFYINAVKLEITERNRVDCTWQLVPADLVKFWLLGTAGISELGLDTVLGL